MTYINFILLLGSGVTISTSPTNRFTHAFISIHTGYEHLHPENILFAKAESTRKQQVGHHKMYKLHCIFHAY